MREKHNGHTDTGRGKREGRVTLLSRSAKRPDTMSRSGLRLPQSRSNVSVAPSSIALLARSRMSKYLPEMYIPPRWSFSAFVPSRSKKKKKRERKRVGLLSRNNRGALHRAHRLGNWKTSNLFWALLHRHVGSRTLFRVQRLRASTFKTRARAGQVNETLHRDGLALVNTPCV